MFFVSFKGGILPLFLVFRRYLMEDTSWSFLLGLCLSVCDRVVILYKSVFLV